MALTFYGMLGLNFWLAVLLSACSVALLGAVIERFFLRPIYASICPSSFSSPSARPRHRRSGQVSWGRMFLVATPGYLQGATWIFGRPFPHYNLFILGTGSPCDPHLAPLRQNLVGRQVRAASWSREMSATSASSARTSPWSSCWRRRLPPGRGLSIPMRPATPASGHDDRPGLHRHVIGGSATYGALSWVPFSSRADRLFHHALSDVRALPALRPDGRRADPEAPRHLGREVRWASPGASPSRP